jgi:hypothetical protein
MSLTEKSNADEIVKSAITAEQDQPPAGELTSNRSGAHDTERIAARIAQRLRDTGFVCEVLDPPPHSPYSTSMPQSGRRPQHH